VEATLRALKATADPNRLRILRILGRGPFNVAELTDVLGVTQSTVSRHLRILAEGGLVDVRRAGTWAWYSLRVEGDGFPSRLLQLLGDAGPALNGEREAVEQVLARRRASTSEFFRRTAPEWDRLRHETLGPSAVLDRIVERIGRGPGTVVDLGTGTGLLLERVASPDRRVIGVDASPEMLQEARRRVEETPLPATELRLGSLEHLPLGDGEADIMVASMVLHHVADVPAVLRELRRGLAPGGRLLVADLEEFDDAAFWQSLGAQWPGFRREDLRAWLAEAGFERVRFERPDPDASADRPVPFYVEAVRAS